MIQDPKKLNVTVTAKDSTGNTTVAYIFWHISGDKKIDHVVCNEILNHIQRVGVYVSNTFSNSAELTWINPAHIVNLKLDIKEDK